LALFSLIVDESISSGEYNPSANPVVWITAEMVSCKKRNGGFINNFSDIFGFFINELILSLTIGMSSSISLNFGGKQNKEKKKTEE
jgi:hypothetical protein